MMACCSIGCCPAASPRPETPGNKDGGKSSLPNLPPEFLIDDLPAGLLRPVRRSSDGVEGFVGSSPVAALQPSAVVPGHTGLRAWGAVCQGVLGMGRDEPRDSGNSEIFFTQTANRYLDHDYSVVGRILVGQAAIDSLAVGFPPAHPDRMVKVRVLADLPPQGPPPGGGDGRDRPGLRRPGGTGPPDARRRLQRLRRRTAGAAAVRRPSGRSAGPTPSSFDKLRTRVSREGAPQPST